MGRMGSFTQRHARATVVTAVIVAVIGSWSASQLVVDEDRIETFDSSERIYQADQVINGYLDGSNNLDIVIETPAAEDLFEPENLAKMEALQTYAETLPHVMGSTSIVDYLKQMNRSRNEGRPEAYRLPGNKELAAQYFLLYSASSEPTDFEEEVDYDYQMANIRVTLNSGSYIDTKVVVEALQDYLVLDFNGPEIKATLSGRVNVSYHWIRDLGASHFAGLGIALLLVWMVSSLLFRSPIAGLYSLLPAPGGTTIQPEYERSHLFGGTLSNAFGDSTLRAEIGYSTDSFHVAKNMPARGISNSPELASVLGLDWQGLSDTFISIQWFQNHLFEYDTATVRDRTEHTMSFLYQRYFASETWKLEVLVLQSLNGHDGLVRPKLTHTLLSNLDIWVGADLFHGNKEGLFGQFDRVVAGFRLGF